MSFGFGIGDFLAILQLADEVRQKWVDAPQEYAAILRETRNLSNILRDISDLEDRVELNQDQKDDLRDAASSCNEVLKTLENIVDKYSALKTDHNTSARRLRRIWKRFKLDPDDIRQVRAQLTSTITALNAVHASITSSWTYEIKEDVSDIRKSGADQRKAEIAEWFAPPTFAEQQNDYLSQRQPGTCTWFLDDAKYNAWHQKSGAILFCPGMPGSGKTVLSATIIQHLRETYSSRSDAVVIYHYFNFRRAEERNISFVLSSFIRQLFQERKSIPSPVEALWAEHNNKGTKPSLEELETLFKLLIGLHKRVFMVTDALDEAGSSSRSQNALAINLLSLHAQTKGGANFLATSRDVADILHCFSSHPILTIRAQEDDIMKYLDARMSELTLGVQRNAKLQVEIKETLIRLADGMFLLARLHFDSLCGETTPRAIRKALEKLPTGSEALFAAYDSARERIDHQLKGLSDLAHKVLMWISYGKRELSIAQIQEAVAIEPDMEDIDREEDLVDERELLSVCAGLVVVDSERNIIRLVHYTAQEYLERVREEWFGDAQAIIASKCVAYLCMDVFGVRDEAEQLLRHPTYRGYSLTEYAAHCWGFHANATANHQILIDELARTLSDKPDNFRVAAHLLLTTRDANIRSTITIRDGITLVHVAAFFGFIDLLKKFNVEGRNMNEEDSHGYTPLAVAAKWNRVDVLDYLLEQPGINVNSVSSDRQNSSPLLLAVRGKRLQVVKSLLRHPDIDVNIFDSADDSLLSVAIWSFDREIVQNILAHKTLDINLSDKFGWTSLARAIEIGAAEAVKMLLANPSIDVNTCDVAGKTPLHHAAEHSNPSCFEMLIRHPGILINTKSELGVTPLIVASYCGCLQSVKLLLSKPEIEVNLQDGLGWTALAHASWQGYTDIIEAFIKRDDVEMSLADTKSRTPLALAAMARMPASIVSLVARHNYDVDCVDAHGFTPLAFASGRRDIASVQLLLTQGADSKHESKEGHTPLSLIIEAISSSSLFTASDQAPSRWEPLNPVNFMEMVYNSDLEDADDEDFDQVTTNYKGTPIDQDAVADDDARSETGTENSRLATADRDSNYIEIITINYPGHDKLQVELHSPESRAMEGYMARVTGISIQDIRTKIGLQLNTDPRFIHLAYKNINLRVPFLSVFAIDRHENDAFDLHVGDDIGFKETDYEVLADQEPYRHDPIVQALKAAMRGPEPTEVVVERTRKD